MNGDHDNTICVSGWEGYANVININSLVTRKIELFWKTSDNTTELEMEFSVRFFPPGAVVVFRRKSTPLGQEIKEVMLLNGIRKSIQKKTDQPTRMENLNLLEQERRVGRRSVPFQVEYVSN